MSNAIFLILSLIVRCIYYKKYFRILSNIVTVQYDSHSWINAIVIIRISKRRRLRRLTENTNCKMYRTNKKEWEKGRKSERRPAVRIRDWRSILSKMREREKARFAKLRTKRTRETKVQKHVSPSCCCCCRLQVEVLLSAPCLIAF